jgi:hypothetical protein
LLDTLRGHFYKTRPLWAAGVLVLAAVALAEMVGGVQLPNGSQKVGEDRYRAPDDFEGTLKYFKSVYPEAKFPRKSIVNQPGVKAIHIENPAGKNFEGLNIYEAAEGEVRIFIVRTSRK